MTMSGAGPMTASLQGMRILIVEDEMMVSMMMEDMLDSFGCEIVGPAANLAEAVRLAATAAIDGAMLDLNLAGKSVYPVAEELVRRDIPFVFVTGYGPGELGSDYKDRPALRKPFRRAELQRIMTDSFMLIGRDEPPPA